MAILGKGSALAGGEIYSREQKDMPRVRGLFMQG